MPASLWIASVSVELKKNIQAFLLGSVKPLLLEKLFLNEPSSSEYRLSGSAALMRAFEVTKMYICFFVFCFYRKFFVTGSKTASWRRFLWCFSKIKACFQFAGENNYSCFLDNKLGYIPYQWSRIDPEWCFSWKDKSFPRVDGLVPLMHHYPGLLILVQIFPKECTLNMCCWCYNRILVTSK